MSIGQRFAHQPPGAASEISNMTKWQRIGMITGLAVAGLVGSAGAHAFSPGIARADAARGDLIAARYYGGGYQCYWRGGFRRCYAPSYDYGAPPYGYYRPDVYLRWVRPYGGYYRHRWVQERFQYPLGRR